MLQIHDGQNEADIPGSNESHRSSLLTCHCSDLNFNRAQARNFSTTNICILSHFISFRPIPVTYKVLVIEYCFRTT